MLCFPLADSMRFTSAISILRHNLRSDQLRNGSPRPVSKHHKNTKTLPRPPHIQSFLKLFTAIPVIVVAFTFHFNVHPIRSELARITDMKPAARVSLRCTFIYVAVGLSRYLLFGEEMMVDVLSNFDESSASPVLDDVVQQSYALHLVLVFSCCSTRCESTLMVLCLASCRGGRLRRMRGGLCFCDMLLAVVYLAAIAIPNVWRVFRFMLSSSL